MTVAGLLAAMATEPTIDELLVDLAGAPGVERASIATASVPRRGLHGHHAVTWTQDGSGRLCEGSTLDIALRRAVRASGAVPSHRAPSPELAEAVALLPDEQKALMAASFAAGRRAELAIRWIGSRGRIVIATIGAVGWDGSLADLARQVAPDVKVSSIRRSFGRLVDRGLVVAERTPTGIVTCIDLTGVGRDALAVFAIPTDRA